MKSRQTGSLWIAAALLLATAHRAGADVATVYFSWSGWADQFADPNSGVTTLNSLLVPVGGNVEGMGTAYTAVARDSGYIEANPAASAQLALTEVSLMHREWISDVGLDSAIYTIRLRDLGLGVAGKFVPIRFTAYDAWGEPRAKAYVTESIVVANASYNFFNTYLNNLRFDGLAVGANLKVAWRGVPAALAGGQSGLGVMLDVGVLTRLNFLKAYASRSKNFSIGAAVKNLGPYVLGEPLPTTITVGIAYSAIRPVLLAVDLNLPVSFQPELFPPEKPNVSTGVDVTVTEFLSLQGGLWLRSSNPRATVGATVELVRTALAVNASIDRSGVSFSAEATVNFGDLGRAARQARIDDLFARAIKAYAAGSYDEATSLSRQVLELQADHAHAQMVLELAEESRATQEEIRRKQAEAAGLLEQTAGQASGRQTDASVRPAGDEGLDN